MSASPAVLGIAPPNTLCADCTAGDMAMQNAISKGVAVTKAYGESPASVMYNGLALCRRHCNARRKRDAEIAAVRQPVVPKPIEEHYTDESPVPDKEAFVPLHPGAISVNRLTPTDNIGTQTMSRVDYIARFGPRSRTDFEMLLKKLKHGDVLLVTPVGDETVKAAKLRIKRALGPLNKNHSLFADDIHNHIMIERTGNGSHKPRRARARVVGNSSSEKPTAVRPVASSADSARSDEPVAVDAGRARVSRKRRGSDDRPAKLRRKAAAHHAHGRASRTGTPNVH